MTGVDPGVTGRRPDTDPLLVSVKEAGRLLGVSRRTIWRLISEGKLETVNIIQRRRLIHYASLQRLVGKENSTQ